jgi:monofunctional biosynthetic peptidoglycan transglycosylase
MSRSSRWGLGLAVGVAGGVLLLGGLAWRETRDLPRESELRQRLWTRYRPQAEWTWLPMWSISPKLQTAVVAWEDPRFYHHHGFDYGEIAAAAETDLEAGAYRRGGSTLTQQVAKNLFLTPEKSWRRKFREAVLARRLERAFTKDQILEIYLNTADWGDGISGAEAASQVYFGHSAESLSWAEAALLAGILANPHRFSPLRNPEEARQLRQRVLAQLVENDEISFQEFREAMQAPCCLEQGGGDEGRSGVAGRASAAGGLPR